MGLKSIAIEKETMDGATIIPSRLMASIIPAAVDYICTENDSVCRQMIRVYPIAMSYDKLYTEEYSTNSNKSR